MLPPPPDGLRYWRPSDADALVAAWGDPEIARWNAVPDDPSPATARRWIAGAEVRWSRRLALDLVVVDAHDQVVGEVGLANLTTEPARAEVGLWVAAECRGQGWATAGLTALARLATTELGFTQLWARVDDANHAAQTLFAGVGWTRVGDRPGTTVWASSPAMLR